MGPFEAQVESCLWEKLALKGSYKGSIFQRLVAAKYVLAPTSEPRAMEAFRELAKKIARQSDFLASKYNLTTTTGDPFSSSKQLTRHIRKQQAAGVRRPDVPVFAEPPEMDDDPHGGHPALTNTQNITQRGVHDVIAHFFGQHPFSARGEYGAYNRHLKTLCNPAQVKSGKCLAAKAMFSEVVAQTSYFYVYGKYAPQKAIILDDFDHARVGQLSRRSPLNRWFTVEAKVFKVQPGFSWSAFSRAEPSLARELSRQQQGSPRTPLEPIGDELVDSSRAAA